MELYQVIILVAIIVLIISLFLNLLFSPITWIVIGVLVIYSMIRKYLYQKQLKEYNEKVEKEMAEKKAAYQSGQAYKNGSDDIIDVHYVEKDEAAQAEKNKTEGTIVKEEDKEESKLYLDVDKLDINKIEG